MSELTKEHFDKALETLATKEYVRDYLGEYTEEVLMPAMGTLIDEKLKPLSDKVDAIDAKLTAHLELSDKRYLELKRRDTVIAKWIKQIADKTGVTIDLAELEKF